MDLDLRPDFGGVEHLPALQQFQFLFVALMLVGQLLFLAMWLLLPWWRHWVGRALMTKSVTLGLLLLSTLVTSVIMLRHGPQQWAEWIATILSGLMVLGIWAQVGAIGHEMREGFVQRQTDAEAGEPA